MNAEKFYTSKAGIILAAGAATFLWGSAFPFIKLSYTELHIAQKDVAEQLLFAGYRFFAAAWLIVLYMIMTKKTFSLKRRDIRPLFKIGLFQTFLQYVFFYIGLSYSTGIQGSIIAGTTTFFQMIVAHFYYKDDALSLKKVIGLLIGFFGVIIVNLTKGDFTLSFGIGEWLLLLAMFFAGIGNVFAKEGARVIDVLTLTAMQMMFGGFGLIVAGASFAGFTPFTFTLKGFFMFIYLASLSAIGFVLWNSVMKYNKVGQVSIYLFLIPVFGVMLSAYFLKEPLSIFVFLGLILVVSGIIVVNREPAKKKSLLGKDGV